MTVDRCRRRRRYSDGGAGDNDGSVPMVVVVVTRNGRLDSGGGRVVAVVLFLPWKGGRFLRDGLPSVRRVGGSRPARHAVWWGSLVPPLLVADDATTGTSYPREFVPHSTSRPSVLCILLFSRVRSASS